MNMPQQKVDKGMWRSILNADRMMRYLASIFIAVSIFPVTVLALEASFEITLKENAELGVGNKVLIKIKKDEKFTVIKSCGDWMYGYYVHDSGTTKGYIKTSAFVEKELTAKWNRRAGYALHKGSWIKQKQVEDTKSGSSLNTSSSNAGSAGVSRSPASSYTVLRQWKPNNDPNGYGAEILIGHDLSEKDLIALIKKLSHGHDPVSIDVWSSRVAYEQSKRNQYGEAFARGFILTYVKNLTGKGAYRGFNEIRWMQEKGKFSAKFGTKTEF